MGAAALAELAGRGAPRPRPRALHAAARLRVVAGRNADHPRGLLRSIRATCRWSSAPTTGGPRSSRRPEPATPRADGRPDDRAGGRPPGDGRPRQRSRARPGPRALDRRPTSRGPTRRCASRTGASRSMSRGPACCSPRARSRRSSPSRGRAAPRCAPASRVEAWDRGRDGLGVRVGGETITTRRLVLAAGAWMPVLAPVLAPHLAIERNVVHWFRPRRRPCARRRAGARDRGSRRSPPLRRAVDARPWRRSRGRRQVRTTPQRCRRRHRRCRRPHARRGRYGCHRRGRQPLPAGPRPDAGAVERLLLHQHPRRPFLRSIAILTTPRVILASPCSGHGFKFAPRRRRGDRRPRARRRPAPRPGAVRAQPLQAVNDHGPRETGSPVAADRRYSAPRRHVCNDSIAAVGCVALVALGTGRPIAQGPAARKTADHGGGRQARRGHRADDVRHLLRGHQLRRRWRALSREGQEPLVRVPRSAHGLEEVGQSRRAG